jgi:Zn-dependent protease with chaperone function
MLGAVRIDPLALKHFLEKILREEGKISGGLFSHWGTIFSTHPITTERIAKIKPLPAGSALKPALSDKQWKDLKAICG